jgi:putative ABC transport system substrate-binding protein
VVAIDYDPLIRGYVRSLARPGGNITGVFLRQLELTAKRIEFLREVVPHARSFAVLLQPVGTWAISSVREKEPR